MAYIGKKPEDAFRGLAYYDTFTGDGSTTTFDLSADAPDGGQNDITVVVDNVRQEPGASKSYTLGDDGSGNYRRITFNVAPDNGSEIYAINPGRSTQLNTVSDNAISAAKIQTDAVTTAKIQDSAVTNDKLAGSIANAKLANSSITINGNAVSLGGSITAGTDWQAVTVADGSTTLNAVAGKGYFLDTNTGVIEVFLPTSPTRGDTIILMDYAGTFATNNVIVNTGTTNLDSTTTRQYKLTTNDTIAEFVYVDSSKGWVTRINTTTGTTPSGVFTGGVYDTAPTFIVATGGTVTESGDFRIHTFTGDGCFVVSSAGAGTPTFPSTVDYLVVAGGGGGPSHRGGGGGAGGFRESKDSTVSSPHSASPLAATTGLTLTSTTYPVTVGAGGSAGCGVPAPGACGSNGSNSVFSTITSTGGGTGGKNTPGKGSDGGSGGGRSGDQPPCGASGIGVGNTPPVSPPQGNDGGDSAGAPAGLDAGGSGGGAGGAGNNGTPSAAGTGAVGVSTAITGTSVSYSGGGGGGKRAPGSGGGASPCGTGGAGTVDGGGAATAGTTNRGGGGGAGGSSENGGAGGKGIVVIRYKFQ